MSTPPPPKKGPNVFLVGGVFFILCDASKPPKFFLHQSSPSTATLVPILPGFLHFLATKEIGAQTKTIAAASCHSIGLSLKAVLWLNCLRHLVDTVLPRLLRHS